MTHPKDPPSKDDDQHYSPVLCLWRRDALAFDETERAAVLSLVRQITADIGLTDEDGMPLQPWEHDTGVSDGAGYLRIGMYVSTLLDDVCGCCSRDDVEQGQDIAWADTLGAPLAAAVQAHAPGTYVVACYGLNLRRPDDRIRQNGRRVDGTGLDVT